MRQVDQIARDVLRDMRAQLERRKGHMEPDWWVHSKPYLGAMLEMKSATGNYGADSARSVILYFLHNARNWRGDRARTLKGELKQLLGQTQ